MNIKTNLLAEYEFFVFDFDGTIIDSKHVMMEALQQCWQLAGRKGDPPYDSFFAMMGESLENIFDVLYLSRELTGTYKQFSSENMNMITVFHRMRESVVELKRNGKIVALFTGKDQRRTWELLRLFQMDTLFDSVVTSDQVARPKPDSEGLIQLLQEFGMSPERTLMVGDGLFDVTAAKHIQVHSAFVYWGTGNPEDIAHLKPEFEFHTPEQFYQTLRMKEVLALET